MCEYICSHICVLTCAPMCIHVPCTYIHCTYVVGVYDIGTDTYMDTRSVHTLVSRSVHKQVYVRVPLNKCMYVCPYMCTTYKCDYMCTLDICCTYLLTYMDTPSKTFLSSIHIYRCIDTHAHIHTHTHTHTHTHKTLIRQTTCHLY